MKAGEPIWWDARQPITPLPAGTLRADVAILGGGLAGLSTAHHLLERRPGARIVVLEAEQLGAGASGRTTGMLSPGVGQSVVALASRLGPERAKATYEATLRAVQTAAALIEREQIPCELELSGQLVLARSPQESRRLATTLATLRALDLPVEVLDEQAASRAVRLRPRRPGALPGPAALRHPIAGLLHPLKFLNGLAARVRSRGGAVYEAARVLEVQEQPQSVRLRTAACEVIAGEVIIAVAGYSAGLPHLPGRVLPVHLQALCTHPLDAEQRALIGWSGREGILDGRRLFSYARLTSEQRIVLGGGMPRYRLGRGAHTESAPSESSDATRALGALARDLHAVFPTPPDRPLRIDRGWTGIIGYTVDALPSIARAPGRARTYHLVGWCGHGIALAIAAGEWMASLLCDGAAPEDLPWFRPQPPLVPTALARYIGFQAAVRTMVLQDRFS